MQDIQIKLKKVEIKWQHKFKDIKSSIMQRQIKIKIQYQYIEPLDQLYLHMIFNLNISKIVTYKNKKQNKIKENESSFK